MRKCPNVRPDPNTYFVDGYNVLLSQEEWDEPIRWDREALIRSLNAFAETTHLSIIVVFDAYRTVEDEHRSHYRSVEVVFTEHGESADQYILREVDRMSHPATMTVVTNDRFLARQVKETGAHHKTVKTFFSFLQKKQNRGKQEEEKPIALSDADHQRWLDIFTER